MHAQIHRFTDRKALLHSMEKILVNYINSGIQQHGIASLVLAGGNTPLPLYSALAEQDLAWSKVQIVASDERWTRHCKDTNEFKLKQIFRTRLQQGLQYFSLLPDKHDIETACQQVEQDLNKIKQPFDCVILGMGEDGHFASLFPNSKGLDIALDPNHLQPCCVIHPAKLPANAPYSRISLTLSALQNTEKLLLLVSGQNKLDLIKHVNDQTDSLKLPVSALLTQSHIPVEVYWSP